MKDWFRFAGLSLLKQRCGLAQLRNGYFGFWFRPTLGSLSNAIPFCEKYYSSEHKEQEYLK